MNGIVVGVDGSTASVAALRWAIAHAKLQHCSVTAVEVRPSVRPLPGTSYAVQPYGSAPPVERSPSRLHATVAATVATIPDAPEVVEMHIEGDPSVELTHTEGSMLVLGYSPHSRITEFLRTGHR